MSKKGNYKVAHKEIKRREVFGLKWFIIQSYRYINPVGFKAHLKFIIQFPKAFLKYAYSCYFE